MQQASGGICHFRRVCVVPFIYYPAWAFEIHPRGVVILILKKGSAVAPPGTRACALHETTQGKDKKKQKKEGEKGQ